MPCGACAWPLQPCFLPQEEVEELQQRQAAAARANKRAGELQAQVRALQESLADANIVLDKVWFMALVYPIS
jgi:hypothetical protein